MKLITAYDWDHGITDEHVKEARLMTTGQSTRARSSTNTTTPPTSSRISSGAGPARAKAPSASGFINPTIRRYLTSSGGPAKVELSAHRDAAVHRQPDRPPLSPLYRYAELLAVRQGHYGGQFVARHRRRRALDQSRRPVPHLLQLRLRSPIHLQKRPRPLPQRNRRLALQFLGHRRRLSPQRPVAQNHRAPAN